MLLRYSCYLCYSLCHPRCFLCRLQEVLHAMKHIHCKADLDKVAMQDYGSAVKVNMNTQTYFFIFTYLLKKCLHLRRKTAREWLHSENLATKRSLQKPQLSVRAPEEQNACELFRSKKVKVSELLESSMRNVKSVMRWRWVGGNNVFTCLT